MGRLGCWWGKQRTSPASLGSVCELSMPSRHPWWDHGRPPLPSGKEEKEIGAERSKNGSGPECARSHAMGLQSFPRPHLLGQTESCWDKPSPARQPRTGLSKRRRLPRAGVGVSRWRCPLAATRVASNARGALLGCAKSLLEGLGLPRGESVAPVVSSGGRRGAAATGSPPSRCTTPRSERSYC